MADGAKPTVGTGAKTPGAHGGQVKVFEIPREAIAAQELGRGGVEVFEIPSEAVAANEIRAGGGEIFEIPAAAVREQAQRPAPIPENERSWWAGLGAAIRAPSHAMGAQVSKAVADGIQDRLDGKPMSPQKRALDAELGAYAHLYPEDSPVRQPLTREQTEAGLTRLRGDQSHYTKLYQDAQQEVLANAPEGPVKKFMYDAFTGVAPSLVLGAGATIAGGPAGTALVLSYLTAPGAMMKADEKGVTGGKKALYATGQAAAEIVTERIPIGKLLKSKAIREAIQDGAGRFPAFAKYIAAVGGAEAAQEAVTQLLQDGLDIGVLNEDMTLEEVLKNMAYAGALGAFGGSAVAAPIGAIEAATADSAELAQLRAARGGPQVAAAGAPTARDMSVDQAFGTVEPEGAEGVQSAASAGARSGVGEAEAGAASPPEVAPAEAEPYGIDSDEFNEEIMGALGYTEEDRAKAWAEERRRRGEAPDPFSPEETQRQDDLRTAASYIVPPPDENGRGIVPDPEVFPTHADMERARSELPKRVGIPGHPAWASRPDRKMKPVEANAAVQKAQRGEQLDEREQRFVDHMLEFVAEERAYQQAVPEERRATDDDYRNAMLEEGDRKLGMLAQRALELGADRDAVDLALESQSDELATEQLNGLIEKAGADQKASAAAGEAGRSTGQKAGTRKAADYSVDTEDDGQFTVKVLRGEDGSVAIFDSREGARTIEYPAGFAADKTDEQLLAYSFEPVGYRSAKTAAAGEKDLLGADVASTEALNARNRQVAKKLGDGRKAPPPGGMFAAADAKEAADARAAQVDLAEVKPEGKQTIYRGTPLGADPDQPGKAGLMFFSNTEAGAAEQGDEVNSRDVDLTEANSQRYPNRAALLADNGVDPKGDGASDPSALYEAARNYFAKPGAKPWLQFGYPELDGNPQEFIHKPPAPTIDDAAHAAATSPKNDLPEPTEAQAKAGVYKKGHVNAHGERWSIEQDVGSVRKFTRPDGTTGERVMQDPYGYVRGTEGKDGDHIDVFFGPQFMDENPHVVAINQREIGSDNFDEVKLMAGYGSAEAALEAYARNYQKGWKGAMSAVETDMNGVREWLDAGRQRGQFPKSRGTPVKSLRVHPPAAASKAVPEDDPQSPKERARAVFGNLVEQAKARWGEDVPADKKLWLEQMNEQLMRPSRYIGEVTEAENAAGLKIGDRVTTQDGKEAFVTAIRAPGTHGTSPNVVHINSMDSYGGWADPATLKPVAATGKKPDKAKLIPRRAEGGGVRIDMEPVTTESALVSSKPVHRFVGKNVSFRGPKGKTQHGKVAKVENDMATVVLDGQDDAQFKAATLVPVTRLKVLFLQDDMAPPDARDEPSKTPVKTGAKPAVSANTIVTEDAAAKAREILRKKLGQLNTGLDPEMAQAGITLAMYHVERGARTFAAYSKAMLDDLGDAVRPYLRSWYEAVRWDPRATALSPEMTPAADIQESAPEAPVERAPEADIQKSAPAAAGPLETILSMFRAGQPVGKTDLGRRFPEVDRKAIEEAIELAIVMRAREIIAESESPAAAYDKLVDLYGQQPNLSTRTSTSVEQQAYSTPAPLAYLASRLADIGRHDTVLEPTAGNGMLLMEVTSPKLAAVNELNPARADALRKLGFNPRQEDAATAKLRHAGYPVNVVIANPPFGTVRLPSGITRSFAAPLPDGKSFQTNEIDHAISMNALQHMHQKGRAVLIIGSVNKQAQGMARSDAYNGAAKRQFFYHLYQHYNVTDHFTVDGKLYAKQGAAWPVDVIVIDGRGRSSRKLPAADVPRQYDSWEALRGLLEKGAVSNDQRVESAPEGPGAVTDEGLVDTAPAAAATDPEPVPVAARPGRSSGRADRPARGRGPDRGSAGTGAVERGPVADRESTDGEPVAEGPADAEIEVADSGDRARALAGRTGSAPSVDGATQVPYTPASGGASMGTLLPANMLDATASALAALEARVGNIDDYVSGKLGWTKEQLYKRLGGEQVDGVALAIDNLDRNAALVLGDMTGIGKGRQVASIIRYALRKGLTPIFVTEKPNLYSDMIRDLRSIEHEDIRVLVTNTLRGKDRVALDQEETEFLESPRKHEKIMRDIVETGDLGDYNMVFTTYNQMQTHGGKESERHHMLPVLARNGFLILDESHNAGGQDSGRKKRGEDESGSKKTGRAAFVRELVNMAKGVLYSSATWAKRPEVMDLYSKTDMRLAVDDINDLSGAIARGGVPLQQAVSAMLARAGQYVRRERSFDGIEYNTPVVEVDLEAASDLSSIMFAVNEFDKAKKVAVNLLKQEAKAEAKAISESGSTGAAGAISTNFTSVMHNVISQMLLALKAQSAVDRALELRKQGKKVVLAVSNTMESFIEEYADGAGLKPGDAINLTFADLMRRYLQKSREIMIKDASGRVVDKRSMTDAELTAGGALAKYKAAEKIIRGAEKIARMPASPIDHIHAGLRAAGVKTAEITGRKLIIDYSGDMPRLSQRKDEDISPAGRVRAISGFNSGTVDAIILNQAGSTGLSLHANQGFKDQTPRWMIVVSPEANIDTHMQLLGRVNRTGQTSLPGYDQLSANIPSEKRPAAVLAKKMASLNANTTAARGSAVTSKETVDFLNVYGDEVVAQLMEDMPELHEKLGEPLTDNPDGPGLNREDAARKVTGRLPILPREEQEEIYEQIESGFKAALAQADALGENALEAKALALDARTKTVTELVAGQKGGSPFAEGAYIEQVDVKRLGKPYTPAQVKEKVIQALGPGRGNTAAETAATTSWSDLRRYGASATRLLRDEAERGAKQWRAQMEAKLEASEEEDSEKNGRLGAFDGQVARFTDIISRLEIGQTYRLSAGENIVYAVLTDVTRKPKVKMPVAQGSWEAHFALADASRSMTLPFSRLAASTGTEEGRVAFTQTDRQDLTGTPVMDLFEKGQSDSRETRYIITGNMLAAVARVRGGQITNYTTDKGEVRQGILLPRSFNLDKFKGEQPVVLSPEGALKFFQIAPRGILQNQTAAVVISKAGDGIQISVPRSKSEGGRFFLDKGLTRITGDFTSRGSRMVAMVPGPQAIAALERLDAMDVHLLAKVNKAEAIKAGGTQLAGGPQQRVDEPPKADLLGRRATATDAVKSGLALRAALDAKFGPGNIKGMIDKGLLRIVASFDNLPDGVRRRLLKSQNGNEAVARKVRGLFDGETGVVYLIGDRASPEQAASLMLHEIGEHYGLKRMLGKDAYHRLQGDVVKLRTIDKQIGAAWDKVKRNYPNEVEGSERFLSEVIARLADNPKVLDASWFQRVVWAVRRFLWSKGLFKIDAEDIRAMLASSLRAAMQVPVAESAPAGAATAPLAAYEDAPDSLMGFSRNGPQKPYSESKYKHEITVRVTFPDGDTFVDGMRGLNRPHAMERARRNWQGATIDWISDEAAPIEAVPLLNLDEDPAVQAQQFVRESLLRMPVDRIFRTITMSPLGRYQNGKFVPWSPVDEAVRKVTASAKQFSTSSFEWLHPSIQSSLRNTKDLLRNAFVDRAGTPEEFRVREAQKEGEIRASLRQIQELGAKLMETVTDENEKIALQQAMLGEEIGDEQIKAVAGPVIDAIEDMGRQLVELGFLTGETWEKNRRKYLHRSYLRHETAFAGGLTKAIDRMVTKRAANRRVRIIGDTFRGRGIFQKVSVDALKRAIGPEFWGRRFEKGGIDVALKNTEWVILDQVVSREVDEQRQLLQGQSGRPDRRVRRVYWPADEAIPNRYAGWENRGTFKVRDVGTGEVTLHRDYTKEERMRMGEIMDARYNIVKTMSLMTKDLATGKFFKDIAGNPEWARTEEPKNIDGSPAWVYAAETTWKRTWQRTPTWVKVPTTTIGGEKGPYRYGQLAGKYVQGAIWRDIAEQEAFMTPGVWAALLRAWKISKTILSPIVHINNIVSNFFLMDLQDVSFGDLKDGIMSRLSLDQDYKDALDHGLFGNNALDRDIEKQILAPILKEIEAANFVGPQARIKLVTKLVGTLFGLGKWTVDKAGFVYQLEDEIFRMATYKKLLAEGVPAFEAAREARRAFIDYDIRAPGINMLRRSVMPFISYSYRAIPLVAGAVAKRPWKLAKYYAIAYALQSLAYLAMGEDDEDEETYKRLMDDQYQGNVWLGVPRMLRLPSNDQYGNPLFLDIRRWVPAGDVFESGQAIEWMPAWLQISGPILIGIEAALNINTFQDRQVYNDRTDTAGEKAAKAAAFVWSGMVPNFALVPGSYAQKDILAAIGKSGENTYNVAGEKKSLGAAIAGGVGVKVRPLSLEGRREQIRAQYGAIIRDLRQQLGGLRSQMTRGNLSEEDYLQRSGVLEMKILDAQAKMQEKLTGNRPPQ